jgi:hypothetical protein
MSRARDTANQINRVNSSAADATAITVDSSENVGIGTTSPSRKLTVSDTTSRGIVSIISNNTQPAIVLFGDSDADSVGQIRYDNSDNSLAFRVNSTERMRVLSSGGITFNGDTAAANALNDYEEGTWTPRIVGSSSESGQSYQRQEGYYTKIGNKVFCRFILNFSARGSFSGDYIMDGFPFNCEGPADINLGSLYHSYVGQNVIYIGLYNRPNDNKAYIWIKTQAGQSREYPNSSFLTNDTELSGSFTIQTTA